MGTTTDKILTGMSLNAAQFTDQWSEMTRGIKDTKRIVSGIMISKSFYTLLRSLSSATKDLYNFHKNMELSTLSLEYFTQGADRAAKAAAYLREMNLTAAKTPISVEPIINMTRYAHATGMATQQIRRMNQTMSDTTAATGATEESMERMDTAIGQVQAKGRITGREIRQLAHAGIPIYAILTEQLGLTQEQDRKSVV